MRPPPSLRQQALMWLAQREHSRKELHDKLVRWVQAVNAMQSVQSAQSAQTVQGVPSVQVSGSLQAPAAAPTPSSSSTAGSPAPSPARPAPSAEDIPALLDELAAAGHLSDTRALESRIHVRSARFGNLRIERELRHLGMQVDAPVRQALRATELARAREVWARKFAGPPASAAERARQVRFLAGRGFTADTIRAVLGGARSEEEDFPGNG
jgi:regulatory protein